MGNQISHVVGVVKAEQRIRVHRMLGTVESGGDCTADDQCKGEGYFCANKTACENGEVCQYQPPVINFWIFASYGECRPNDDKDKPVCSAANGCLALLQFCGFLGDALPLESDKAGVCYERKERNADCSSDEECYPQDFCVDKIPCEDKICPFKKGMGWGGKFGMCRPKGEDRKAVNADCSFDLECPWHHFCGDKKPSSDGIVSSFTGRGDEKFGKCRPIADKNKAVCSSQKDCDQSKYFCGYLNQDGQTTAVTSDTTAETLCYEKKPAFTQKRCYSDVECSGEFFCGFWWEERDSYPMKSSNSKDTAFICIKKKKAGVGCHHDVECENRCYRWRCL